MPLRLPLIITFLLLPVLIQGSFFSQTPFHLPSSSHSSPPPPSSALSTSTSKSDLRQLRSSRILAGPSSLPPSQDPFYSPDRSIAHLSPGTVLKWRQVRILEGAENVRETWQVLFRTESANGTALCGVTTIWVPREGMAGSMTGAGESKREDRVVVSASPTAGLGEKCANSWSFVNGTVRDDRFLSKGWIVTSPDYTGPSSALSDGHLSGRLMLDAARATLSFTPLRLTKHAKLVLTGYSSGAVAAGWAAQLAHTYAPELNIVGAAVGGMPADGRAMLKDTDGGFFAGLSILNVFGLAQSYSAWDKRLKEIVTEKGTELWSRLGSTCVTESVLQTIGQSLLSDEYTTLGDKLLEDKILRQIMDSNILGADKARTPHMPLFVHHGGIDEIVKESSVQPTIDGWCDNGASLIYARTAIAEHFAEYNNANVVSFIEDRFRGTPFPVGCRFVDMGFPFEKIDFRVAKMTQESLTAEWMEKEAVRAQARERTQLQRLLKADRAHQRSELVQRLAVFS